MSDNYKAYLANIDEFKPDSQNVNRHTSRGMEAVKKSMSKRGYARPAFAASDGTVLGGNMSTLEVAVGLEVGNGKVLVVETDGQLPIIHKRTDIQPGTKEAHLLAIEDNRTAELSLDWDSSIMVDFMQNGLDLTELWNPDELSVMLEGAADSIPDFKEYDESVEGEVEYCTCPNCGTKFPK